MKATRTVFTRTGGVWSEQASLAGTPRFILTYWGGLLALSGDGDTALVGSSFRDHLFLGERAGSKWAPVVCTDSRPLRG